MSNWNRCCEDRVEKRIDELKHELRQQKEFWEREPDKTHLNKMMYTWKVSCIEEKIYELQKLLD